MAGEKKETFAPMIGWLYDLSLWIFSVLIDLFFREVHPRGSWKVPKRGAVIFVAAPHANQVRFCSCESSHKVVVGTNDYHLDSLSIP